MKKVNKDQLNELIRLSRKYWKRGDADILDTRTSLAREMSYKAFKTESYWNNFADLVDGCVNLNKHSSNRDIYKIFEILGFEIVQEEVKCQK